MKNLVLPVLLTLAVQNADVFSQLAPSNITPTKPKIGIMKFEVGEGLRKDLGVLLYNGLMDTLVNSRQLTVVDWEEIDRVLGYLNKAQPNLSPDEARKQAGHQLGLEKMFVGSISKVAEKYYFSVKVLALDLSVERVERLTADKEDGLETCAGQMGNLLLVSPEQARQLRAEYDAWGKLQGDKSETALKAFLDLFPKSVHAKEAEETYQKLRAERLDREKKQELANQAEAQQREKAAQLRNNIAGAWRIEGETATYKNEQIPGIYNGVVNIERDGKNISFEALTCICSFGFKSKMLHYKGIYDANTLSARANKTQISAEMDESGNKLIGRWTSTEGGWSHGGKLEMTRVGTDTKP